MLQLITLAVTMIGANMKLLDMIEHFVHIVLLLPYAQMVTKITS